MSILILLPAATITQRVVKEKFPGWYLVSFIFTFPLVSGGII